MKLEGYRIEISQNSYILFNKEKDYLNLLKIENQIRYLFKDIFQGKCDKKEIYNNIDVIKKKLNESELEKIEIFYNPYESENPFRVKFPYICFYEDEEKKDDLYYSIKKFKDKKLEKKSHNLEHIFKNTIISIITRKKDREIYLQ